LCKIATINPNFAKVEVADPIRRDAAAFPTARIPLRNNKVSKGTAELGRTTAND
jgi:hypothetical protein